MDEIFKDLDFIMNECKIPLQLLCKECDQIFDNCRLLKRHMARSHGHGVLCDQCGDIFTTFKGFKVHYNRQHECKEIKIFKCGACDLQMTDRKLIIKHYMKMHYCK